RCAVYEEKIVKKRGLARVFIRASLRFNFVCPVLREDVCFLLCFSAADHDDSSGRTCCCQCQKKIQCVIAAVSGPCRFLSGGVLPACLAIGCAGLLILAAC